MSAAQRLPVLAGTLGIGAALVACTTVPAARNVTFHYLGVSAPGGIWRILAIGFALLNLKNVPFAWHYRVFRHILFQLYLAPKPMSAPDLFKPVITSSYNAITECDYNLHKSNSTYFADLDAARAALMGALLRKSLARLNRGDMTGLPEEAKTTKGSYIIALGAVACTFRKEIKPLESFEIWTKVLTWDEKWIYVISHVVKKDAKKPTSFSLQPWKKSSKNATREAEAKENKDWTKSVFATSIAKYVCKKGRLTIPPEIFLARGDLLPPKPSNLPFLPSTTDSPTTGQATGQATPANLTSPENLVAGVMAKLGNKVEADNADGRAVNGEDWSWEDVEKERLRGLALAKNFDSLAALHGEFGADEEVLGKYSDTFFW